MDISSLNAISGLTGLSGTSGLSRLTNEELTEIYSAQNDTLSSLSGVSDENAGDFSSILDSMLNSVNETNTLQNQAEAAAIQFALGESDNTHDLLIAQTKANTALQYTVAVRDRLIEAYQQIMQMQI
ncbi:MAG: flagellar hook-basal body complex protein FliE [Agathobacter sp.]|nr:flagellar hook-basal body complex protein FliE [Agathobacter sp.]